MTFDPHSLEQLRALGRQLPKELPKPTSISHEKESNGNSKRHPIETETDPQTLFQELIKASPDGNVPSHLLIRLKEVETKQQNPKITRSKNPTSNQTKHPLRQKKDEEAKEEILYASFNRFLLEEEE